MKSKLLTQTCISTPRIVKFFCCVYTRGTPGALSFEISQVRANKIHLTLLTYFMLYRHFEHVHTILVALRYVSTFMCTHRATALNNCQLNFSASLHTCIVLWLRPCSTALVLLGSSTLASGNATSVYEQHEHIWIVHHDQAIACKANAIGWWSAMSRAAENNLGKDFAHWIKHCHTIISWCEVFAWWKRLTS